MIKKPNMPHFKKPSMPHFEKPHMPRLTKWRYILPEPFISLKRNIMMTIAAVLTVVITLYLCGIFGILVMNIDENATKMENSVEIKAFIADDLSQEQVDALSEDVKSLDGVDKVDYVSKAEGLESMSEEFGDSADILAAVETNPLPNSYTISAKTPDDVAGIVAELEKMSEIDEVRYGQGTVENLFLLMKWLRIMGVAIMILLGLCAVVLISMNIRLSVSARKEEIQVMKYVGATNSFIIWPFILEGILLGLLGSILGIILVLCSYNGVLAKIVDILQFMTFLKLGDVAGLIVALMLLMGVVLGALGSAIAVRKHIQV